VNRNSQKRFPRRGGTLVLVVFALTALLGVAALAVDLGLAQAARQRAQANADAAALAGAATPDTAAGSAAAIVAANGSDYKGLAVSMTADGTVTVSGYVNAPLAFAPAVGYAPRGRDGAANTLSVSATATARRPSACALTPGMSVAPFAVIGDDPSSADPAVQAVSALLSGMKTLAPGAYQPTSTQVVLKLNVWDQNGNLSQRGSFDPVLLSDKGSTYFDSIRQTTDGPLMAGQSLSTPPLAYDSVFYTRQYLAARLAPSNTQFTHRSATYDAWFGSLQEQTDGHLLLLPVVSQSLKDRPGSVSIIAFAAFWIDQPYPTGAAGNAIALGRFLGISVPSSTGGACAPAGTRAAPHLVP